MTYMALGALHSLLLVVDKLLAIINYIYSALIWPTHLSFDHSSCVYLPEMLLQGVSVAPISNLRNFYFSVCYHTECI